MTSINLSAVFPLSGNDDWVLPFSPKPVVAALRGATKAFMENSPRRCRNAYNVAKMAAKAAEDPEDLQPIRWMGEETHCAVGTVIYSIAVAEGLAWEESIYMAEHAQAAINRLVREAPQLITEKNLRKWATETE